jgi:hypothetical protein
LSVNSKASWRLEYQAEIEHAIQARLIGNEGMARVCARRAAGIIIGEFLLRQGYTNLTHSDYDRIAIFNGLPDINQQCKDIASHFLLKVTTDHKLPKECDLVSDAMKLENTLLNDYTN